MWEGVRGAVADGDVLAVRDYVPGGVGDELPIDVHPNPAAAVVLERSEGAGSEPHGPDGE